MLPESTHILVYVGLLLLVSQVAGRLAGALRVPRVVGYLIAGIFVGPSLLGLLDQELVEQRLGLITDIALAVIAFSIGGALRVDEIKRIGRSIFCITVCQAIGAVVVVGSTLIVLGMLTGALANQESSQYFLPMVVIVAAISAATAPAAVMGIVHEYRARGPLTTVLIGVVAIDDGLTIIFYAFAIAAAQVMLGLTESFDLHEALLVPFGELGGSLLIGVLAGASLRFATHWFTQRTSLLAIATGVLLLTSGAAATFHASPLLATMALGCFVANFVEHSDDIFERIEGVEEPIFGLFFALAGAHLDLSLLWVTGGAALVITVARFVGKVLGARVGTTLTKSPPVVRRYLGISLLPQAGVTIGLILHARGELSVGLQDNGATSDAIQFVDYFVNAILASVVINELLTPFLLRFALIKSGEAGNSLSSKSELEP